MEMETGECKLFSAGAVRTVGQLVEAKGSGWETYIAYNRNAEWTIGWPQAQRKWCCKKEQVGCPKEECSATNLCAGDGKACKLGKCVDKVVDTPDVCRKCDAAPSCGQGCKNCIVTRRTCDDCGAAKCADEAADEASLFDCFPSVAKRACSTNKDCARAGQVCHEVVKDFYMDDTASCNDYRGGCYCEAKPTPTRRARMAPNTGTASDLKDMAKDMVKDMVKESAGTVSDKVLDMWGSVVRETWTPRQQAYCCTRHGVCQNKCKIDADCAMDGNRQQSGTPNSARGGSFSGYRRRVYALHTFVGLCVVCACACVCVCGGGGDGWCVCVWVGAWVHRTCRSATEIELAAAQE